MMTDAGGSFPDCVIEFLVPDRSGTEEVFFGWKQA
jgi:hypothetical protein